MWIFRWYIFYPLTVLIAVGVVLASLGPALVPEKGPQPAAGTEQRGALVFAGEALANPQMAANTVFFVPRDERNWSATGLRVAIRPNSGLVAGEEHGVEILLDRTAADWLGTGPVWAEIETTPLPLSGANQLAFGLRRGDRTHWAMKNLSAIRDTLVFEFPAPEGALGAVRSLALRPISSDPGGNRGVEIRAIRLRRGAAPAPPPPPPAAQAPLEPTPETAPETTTAGAPEAPPPS